MNVALSFANAPKDDAYWAALRRDRRERIGEPLFAFCEAQQRAWEEQEAAQSLSRADPDPLVLREFN